jgi:hypothetical protein
VQEDTEVFGIHVLWDTPDLHAAMDAAFLHGQAFFRPNLTGGSVFATLNSAANGIRKRYGNLGWIVQRSEASGNRTARSSPASWEADRHTSDSSFRRVHANESGLPSE